MLILFIFILFAIIGFIHQVAGQTYTERVLQNFVCQLNSVRYRRRVHSYRKLSGWHSFADRRLQVQDTVTFNIYIYRLVIFAIMYWFVAFYSSMGRYGRSGSTKGTSGECLEYLSCRHVHVLEPKIRVAYSLAVQMRVGERMFKLVPPSSRNAM